MWTHFMDMHSGGGRKLDWEHIYIEAPEAQARAVFWNRFGRNPDKVTCTCCGNDYSVSESEDLAQATAYQRNCASGYVLADGSEVEEIENWARLTKEERIEMNRRHRYFERQASRFSFGKYMTLEEFMKRADVHFIDAPQIKDSERTADIPQQGYVWAGD